MPPNHPTADSLEARRYNRLKRRLGIADFILGLVILLLLLVTGWTGAFRDSAYRAAGQNYSLAVFMYVLMLSLVGKLASLGLDYYRFQLERQYKLSNQKPRSWAWDQFKGWLVSLALAVIAVEIVYFIIRNAPQYWWVWAWLVFIVLFLCFAQIAPVVLLPIFYRFVPLEDEELKQRLLRLSERAGTRVRGVYEWKLSEKSRKANAALTGLGATRRILLADTLLANYSHDEIEAVLAHELGHHVHRHIPKSIGVQVAVTFVGFWAGNQALAFAIERLHWFETLADFANLPLLALVSAVLSFLLLPAMNAFSRHNERQADRYCFGVVPSVAPYISALNKLGEQNLAERQPSRFVEWFFHSHPSISKRVAAAEAWAQANRQNA
ncbi:MAG: M48 family metallopeptidase [Acidobacteria bacterium]|nr:M48 family metallopeptidase [Acidobacteriota bacterium]